MWAIRQRASTRSARSGPIPGTTKSSSRTFAVSTQLGGSATSCAGSIRPAATPRFSCALATRTSFAFANARNRCSGDRPNAVGARLTTDTARILRVAETQAEARRKDQRRCFSIPVRFTQRHGSTSFQFTPFPKFTRAREDHIALDIATDFRQRALDRDRLPKKSSLPGETRYSAPTGCRERLLAARRLADDLQPGFACEHGLERVQEGRIVVDEQNPDRLGLPSRLTYPALGYRQTRVLTTGNSCKLRFRGSTRRPGEQVPRVAFRLFRDNGLPGKGRKREARRVVSGVEPAVLRIGVLVDAESHRPLACQNVRLLCGDARLKIGHTGGSPGCENGRMRPFRIASATARPENLPPPCSITSRNWARVAGPLTATASKICRSSASTAVFSTR